MRVNREKEGSNLDAEWIYLIVQAKEIGLKPDEVREFLRSVFKS